MVSSLPSLEEVAPSMMGIKKRSFAPLENISLEDLVPKDNFYRRLEEKLDLSFVRGLVAERYAASSGRLSIDPVVFFKLQLVLFFEDLRSERQLMKIASDRLSIRWYLGYDLNEPLPDHSTLTRIRERYGLEVFRRFFEEIVELCIEAGLVWGKELYFDSTKVKAKADVDSLLPRFAVEAHLKKLFEDQEAPHKEEGATESAPSATPLLEALPTANDQHLKAKNALQSDWISRNGAQDRSFKGQRTRTSDLRASKTDPDATPMKWPTKQGGTSLGYQVHYAVDGGKARIILGVLVTPSEVTENRPMLDLLWRARFRWQLPLRQVTGDAKYGTAENIAGVEREGIRAYMALHRSGGKPNLFGREDFTYDSKADVYICPAGEPLRAVGKKANEEQAGKIIIYRAKASSCKACELRQSCTTSKKQGRYLRRGPLEEYVDQVRAYRGSEPYEKALRKRRVWMEPLFGEAKQWHRLLSFRLRMLEKVNIEGLIVASGQNIKRLLAARGRGPRDLAQAVALPLPEPAQRTRFGCASQHCRPYRRRTQRWMVQGDPRVFQHAGTFLTHYALK
jgi:transposase